MAPCQTDNVGNAGDTLKHAPIPDLIDLLLELSTRVAYFDPFAFALDAPLASRVGYARWHADLKARQSVRPAYGRLLDLQTRWLAVGGTYRCGIGLALDAIGSGRLSWLLAAESDPVLRERLEVGLRNMGVKDRLVGGAVLPDARKSPASFATSGVIAQAGEGVFALIDPFSVLRCPWKQVLEGLALAVRPGAHAIALVFNFGEIDWPSVLSPAERLHLVGRIHEHRFQLAAYATEALEEKVARALDRFGWS